MSSQLADARLTAQGSAEAAAATSREASRGLLELLGLPATAGADQVRALRDDLAQHLASAPGALQPWAERQLALAEAALVLVDGDTAAEPNLVDAPETVGTIGEPASLDDEVVVRRPATRSVPASRPGGRVPVRRRPKTRKSARRSPLVMVGAVVLAVGMVVGIYFAGGSGTNNQTASPGTTATAGATGSVNAQMVSALMAKLQADPRDIDSMRALGQVYFQADRYSDALIWQQKILAISPNDLEANLAAGINSFNMSDLTAAKKYWDAAIKINPKSLEAHYNLGFWFISQAPPNMDAAQREWQTVVKLDPKSGLGQDAAEKLTHFSPAAKASAKSSAQSSGR